MDSKSFHYRLAGGSNIEYRPSRYRPYGGVPITIPVRVIQESDMVSLGELPVINVDKECYGHLRMFALGAYQPLTGFMGTEAVRSVLLSGCLPDALPWQLPVYLESSRCFAVGSKILLRYEQLELAQLKVTDYSASPVALREYLGREPDYVIGGELTLLMYPDRKLVGGIADWNDLLDRALLGRNDKRTMALVGVQAWRADDEYLLRMALVMADRVLLHGAPDTDNTVTDRLPRTLADRASRAVINEHYHPGQVCVSPLPSWLCRGRLSPLQLAIIYQNLGCQMLGVVSELAQDDRKALAAVDIVYIELKAPFHCAECEGPVTERECVHSRDKHFRLGENEILNKLLIGDHLPPMVARPEIARLLSREVSRGEIPGAAGTMTRHIFPHASKVTDTMRQRLNGHRAAVLWMTGLSGSGKSTLATGLEKELLLSGHQVCVLDGDTLRNGLCGDLGFSAEGRKENLRRAAETAKLLMRNGMLVVASFISPFAAERTMLREIIGKGFTEVYIEASLEDCERRDPKGLYQRARSGLIPNFTGISSPYEAPAKPDLRVNTSLLSIEDAVRFLLFELRGMGLLKGAATFSTVPDADGQQAKLFFNSGRSN
jgi:adenylylsulfate kinase